MVVLKKNNLNTIRLSSSTIYALENDSLFLKCCRNNNELIINGNRYKLNLLLNSLLIGSPIDTIKKLTEHDVYNKLEEGGFLE